MGRSKLPFYAYVDETGNTGHNLFDEAQPDFYTAALITKGDFDLVYTDTVKAITRKLGVADLHGKQLGVKRIASIAPDILSVLSRSNAQFFISRVEKSYLLASKMFDTFFDSGENAAIAWHHYNLRPNRLILTFKLAECLDLEVAQLFWKCILEPNEQKYREMLLETCAMLRKKLESLKDASARKILDGGLEWASKYPECIQVHQDRKDARKGHFPNMVAFSNLLDGLDQHTKRYKRPLARITHDRQSEFEKNLANMHDMFSNASPEELEWAGEKYTLQRVVGSEFEVKEDGASAGIQVTDVLLWLYHQMWKGTDLPDECYELIEYGYINGWHSDFSFNGVGRSLNEKMREIMEAPFSPEQEAKAREMLAYAEEARLRSMKQYEIDGAPPFARGGTDLSSKATAALLEKS